MTNRPTNHEDKEIQQSRANSPFTEFNGHDSYCNPPDYSKLSRPDEITLRRVSKKQLEEIVGTLSERDKAVLSSLQHCRYIMTKQIQRLHYADAVTSTAGLRAANRNLTRLKDMGLADTLTRRIGGVRSGSCSLIWYLTQAGERLLRMTKCGVHSRKRDYEPSQYFLTHTLAVAECFVQITEICAGPSLKLVGVELETDCWRSYTQNGKLTALKPDLFAITNCDDYEDRWFFEIDLSTEAPATVIEKCLRYHQYYRSGLEQKKHKVFPLTVWIVPDAARKDSLTSYIKAEFAKMPKIFIVITSDELEKLLRQGVEGGSLC